MYKRTYSTLVQWSNFIYISSSNSLSLSLSHVFAYMYTDSAQG